MDTRRVYTFSARRNSITARRSNYRQSGKIVRERCDRWGREEVENQNDRRIFGKKRRGGIRRRISRKCPKRYNGIELVR